ncbi:MAG: hypothetical protein ABWK53_05320 [Anaerolineales bacterium]
MKKTTCSILSLLLLALAACNLPGPAAGTPTASPTPTPLPAGSTLFLFPARPDSGRHIALSSADDADTEIVGEGRRTGNGRALSAADGNATPDSYIQFDISDAGLFAGQPTSSIRLDIEYLDEGLDSFVVQYDAAAGGPYGDGRFFESWPIYKTGSGEYRTVSLVFKDVYFGNRDNGADLRIFDRSDGAETIRKVSITLLPNPTVINVDECGANPYDDEPDSDAIQACINRAQSGDIITFTSGENSPGYRGYLINKTIFLNMATPRSYLTFTSTDPLNHALLQATADLHGFVVKLFARSQGGDPAQMDYMTLTHLHLDGNRQERTCFGADGIANGVDDNWGSWLPECTIEWDSACLPGTLDMAGALDWNDPQQNYIANPGRWTVGHRIQDVHITNTECGTAFGLGAAASVLLDNTIENAGDHVHAGGCAQTDDSEGLGDWSDGITFDGPSHLVMGNTVVNPSDIGIVFFGGRLTIIRENTIRVESGNHGAFSGIAIHTWSFGDISFSQVTGNTIISEGDETCGNLHTGIDIGPHMWGGACLSDPLRPAIGLPGCSLEPDAPQGALCGSSETCQVWASVAQEDAFFLLTDNYVRGAHINYLIEGLDLVGELIENNNVSETPRRSDWDAAWRGCDGVHWRPTDKVAHHPSLSGWTDLRVHCER